MSAPADNPRILCVGRLYCDVIFTDLPRMPTPGTEVFAGGVGLHAGGGAAITAGHLSSLGHPTSLAAYLPGAAFGDVVTQELQAHGIDLRLCRKSTERSDPQLTVALGHNGERAFVTHRTGPAFPSFSANSLADMHLSHLHIGEAATLIDNPQLISIAKSLGMTTSLDCSWDDQLDAESLIALLPEIDLFLPNQSEIEFLSAKVLSASGSALTVIKQGADGATALLNGTRIHMPAISVTAIDTTGAGDAFNASFLNAWLQKRPIEECLMVANRKGAEAVTYRGGMGGISDILRVT